MFFCGPVCLTGLPPHLYIKDTGPAKVKAQPTKRNPVELSAQGASDGLCNAGLPNTRRTSEAEDRSRQLWVELPHLIRYN